MTPPRSSDGTPITPPEPSRAAAPVSRGDRIQADPGRPAELPPGIAGGEKAKARDILAAIRTLQAIEPDRRPATPQERAVLARFGGFGAVALSLFPDPVTGRYKDAGWQVLGDVTLFPP